MTLLRLAEDTPGGWPATPVIGHGRRCSRATRRVAIRRPDRLPTSACQHAPAPATTISRVPPASRVIVPPTAVATRRAAGRIPVGADQRRWRPATMPARRLVPVGLGAGRAEPPGTRKGLGAMPSATGGPRQLRSGHSADVVCRVRPLQRRYDQAGHATVAARTRPRLRASAAVGAVPPATPRRPRPRRRDPGAGRAARPAAPPPGPRPAGVGHPERVPVAVDHQRRHAGSSSPARTRSGRPGGCSGNASASTPTAPSARRRPAGHPGARGPPADAPAGQPRADPPAASPRPPRPRLVELARPGPARGARRPGTAGSPGPRRARRRPPRRGPRPGPARPRRRRHRARARAGHGPRRPAGRARPRPARARCRP